MSDEPVDEVLERIELRAVAFQFIADVLADGLDSTRDRWRCHPDVDDVLIDPDEITATLIATERATYRVDVHPAGTARIIDRRTGRP